MQADFTFYGEDAFNFKVVAIVEHEESRLRLEKETTKRLIAAGKCYNAVELHGRPKSPCAKCGGTKRNANGNCVACYREYMRAYRKEWRAKRKQIIDQGGKTL